MQAASNLTLSAKWPGDLIEIHYRIVRDELVGRLRAAAL